MLASLVAPVLLFWRGLAPLDACTDFPSWTIRHFRSNSTDEVDDQGTASFSLTNNLSGDTDDLSCPLERGYRCTIEGTPTDANLTVTLAIRSEALTLSLDRELDCPDRTTPLHVIADGDLVLNCTSVTGTGEAYQCSLEEDTIQSAPVELAPDGR